MTPLLACGLAPLLLVPQGLLLPDRDFDGTEVTQVAFQDYFGRNVAVSDRYAVMAAYNSDSPGTINAGAIYVAERTPEGDGWTRPFVLRPPTAIGGTLFGFVVDVWEDWIVVGAPYADPGGLLNAGLAYVYQRTGSTWVYVQTLEPGDPSAIQEFGWSAAIDSGRIVIGARGDDEVGLDRGAAYVFVHDGGQWVEEAKLLPPPWDLGAGWAVDISGATVVVGAPGNGVTSAALVYERDPLQGWGSYEELHYPNPMHGDRAGAAVAIDGDTLISGLPLEYSPHPVRKGSVHIFERVAGSWTHAQRIEASDGVASNTTEQYGNNLDVHGDRILVGASRAVGSVDRPGRAYIYERQPSGTWLETLKLEKEIPAAYDAFGEGVALCEGMALVGAYAAETLPGIRSGAAYAFDLPLGEDYCPNPANSTGLSAQLEVLGSPLAEYRTLRLEVSQLPPGQNALGIASLGTATVPGAGGGVGTLCLGLPVVRLLPLQNSGTSGFVEVPVLALDLLPGVTWHFQCWYRDQNPTPTTNLSQAVSLTLR